VHCSAHLTRLPLLRIIPFLRACCRHYPGGPAGCTCCSLLPQHRPSPSLWWVGSPPMFRGLLDVRCALRPARIADPLKGPFLGVLQPICHLLVRSEGFRLEQQFAGRDSYPLRQCAFARHAQRFYFLRTGHRNDREHWNYASKDGLSESMAEWDCRWGDPPSTDPHRRPKLLDCPELLGSCASSPTSSL
jgi:hypothetical protein